MREQTSVTNAIEALFECDKNIDYVVNTLIKHEKYKEVISKIVDIKSQISIVRYLLIEAAMEHD